MQLCNVIISLMNREAFDIRVGRLLHSVFVIQEDPELGVECIYNPAIAELKQEAHDHRFRQLRSGCLARLFDV